MQHRGWKAAALGVVTIVGLSPTAASAVESEEPDPDVVAARERRGEADAERAITSTLEVQEDQIVPPPGARVGDLYYLDATNTTGGRSRVFARDHPAQDKRGHITTTMRIYGNAAAFRDGAGEVSLESKFTCTGTSVSNLSIGSSSVSISSGVGSKTLTWTSSRTNSSVVRQSYEQGGHFRCKTSNVTFAKTTRRGIAIAKYKETDVRAEDAYSFWW